MKAFIGDIEATVFNGKKKETRAWLICFTEYDTNYSYYFKSIDTAMDFMLKENEANFFLHNLKSYDSNFLLEWLESKGYEFIYEKTAPKDDKRFVVGGNEKNFQGHFTIYTKNHALNNGFAIQNVFDTTKYLKETVADIGKSLGLPKGKTPLIKHSNKPIKVTQEHEQYITRDNKIVKEAMKRYGFMEAYENRIYSIGNFALQQALAGHENFNLDRIDEFEAVKRPKGWKKRYATKRFKKYQHPTVKANAPKGYEFGTKRGKANYIQIEKYIEQVGKEIEQVGEGPEKKRLERDLEQLERYKIAQGNFMLRLEQNEKGRLSFKGGLIYAEPKKRNKWINRLGITLDSNSIHPYQIATQKLPNDFIDRVKNVDEFNKYYGNGDYLYLADITRVKAKVKKGRMPVVKLREEEELQQSKGYEGILSDMILSEIDYKTVLAQPDFEYLLENYDIEQLDYSLMVMDVNYDLMARLKKHIEFWFNKKKQAKEESDWFAYSEAKAMMNNVYGFLGVNKDEKASMAKSFVCVASFISAYSRVLTANTINKIGMIDFCYSAVDSIHMILPDSCKTDSGAYDKAKTHAYFKGLGIKIDDFELGAWKIEGLWNKAKYISANCYGENDVEHGWETTISGYKEQVAMKDFKVGYKGTHNIATKVKGGTLLLPTEYRILGL